LGDLVLHYEFSPTGALLDMNRLGDFAGYFGRILLAGFEVEEENRGSDEGGEACTGANF
jgi:hypothetical protein